jgi:hypothetical protein
MKILLPGLLLAWLLHLAARLAAAPAVALLTGPPLAAVPLLLPGCCSCGFCFQGHCIRLLLHKIFFLKCLKCTLKKTQIFYRQNISSLQCYQVPYTTLSASEYTVLKSGPCCEGSPACNERVRQAEAAWLGVVCGVLPW